LQDTVGSFTEPSHFTSAGEALDFGKARAHTFIDDICFEGRPLALPHLSVSILALYVPIFGPAEKASCKRGAAAPQTPPWLLVLGGKREVAIVGWQIHHEALSTLK
jgi:hypothetical protein